MPQSVPKTMDKKEKQKQFKQAMQEEFDQNVASLRQAGYHKEKVSIGIIKANVMAVVYGVILCVPLGYLYIRLWESGQVTISLGSLILFLSAMILSLAVHEGLHGITWGFFCEGKWKSVSYGFLVEKLTPYTHCKVPMRIFGYMLGGLMPLLVLGFGSYVVSLASGNLFVFLFSMFSILGAGGDITIFIKGIRYWHRENLLLDLPEECGFMVFKKE